METSRIDACDLGKFLYNAMCHFICIQIENKKIVKIIFKNSDTNQLQKQPQEVFFIED